MEDAELHGLDGLTSSIIGAAIEVHRALGPGLLESAYAACLSHELGARGLRIERERAVPLVYGHLNLECAYRLDLLVEGLVIVEVKALEVVLPLHKAQLLSYLRLTGCPIGLLVNFNVTALTRGLHRVINSRPARPGCPLRPPLLSAVSAFKEPSR